MRSVILSLAFAASISPLFAQLPIVDITMVPLEDGRLELRFRPDANFTGIFSALVFTIRYPEGSAATLGEFTATGGSQFGGVYPDLSGDVQYAGGFAYATFAGFGLATTNPSWTAGTEMVFGHFPVLSGPGDFSLVNDDWTASHNGDYFVSLNGMDRTGMIYETTTTVPEYEAPAGSYGFRAIPGSNTGMLTVESSGSGVLGLEIVDANGRIVHRWSEAMVPGLNHLTVQAPMVAPGLYRLHSTSGAMSFSAPWFIEAR